MGRRAVRMSQVQPRCTESAPVLPRYRLAKSAAPTWPPMALVPTGLRPVHGASKAVRQRGYSLHDARTDQAVSYEQLSELVPGAVIFHVAGTSHRLDALQSPAFAPGQPVALVPEPRNPYDRNAIGVWDKDRRAQVGYVPRELAPGIGQAIRRREALSAVCNFEFLENRRRTGLSVLLAPTAFLQSLTVEDDEERSGP